MTNTNYKNGANFERKVKKELEAEGWSVFRTAGSHGIFDLIAFKVGNRPLCIQCKISGKISDAEIKALKDWGFLFKVDVSIASRKKVGRKYYTVYE